MCTYESFRQGPLRFVNKSFSPPQASHRQSLQISEESSLAWAKMSPLSADSIVHRGGDVLCSALLLWEWGLSQMK